jgi:hypothetical protein
LNSQRRCTDLLWLPANNVVDVQSMVSLNTLVAK